MSRCPVCGADIPPDPIDAFDKHWTRHATTLSLDDGRAFHKTLRKNANGDPKKYRASCLQCDRAAQQRAFKRTHAKFRIVPKVESPSKLFWDGEEWHNFEVEDDFEGVFEDA